MARRVDEARRVVTFPPDLVLEAMARAPRVFTLAARESAFDLPLTDRRHVLDDRRLGH